MEETEILKLINQLDWNLPKRVQEEAINKLVSIDDNKIGLLIQPIDKKFWENAAITIKRIGYPRNSIIIYALLKWLQDMNWPGASVVVEIIKDVPKNDAIAYIKKALIDAKSDNDYMWIGSLKRLITSLNISKKDFNDDGVYNVINLADW